MKVRWHNEKPKQNLTATQKRANRDRTKKYMIDLIMQRFVW